MFPLHLRGTGGSFATNVGGRMIGTSAAFLTSNIVAMFPIFKATHPSPSSTKGLGCRLGRPFHCHSQPHLRLFPAGTQR
jgi:hypothetical protein